MIRFLAFRIFVVPPSALLTDHRPHGDGLLAFGFIRELAARGHELHVAASDVDLREPPPPGVHVHRLGAGRVPAGASRLRFTWRVRELLGRLRRTTPLDLAHQLNPVDVGVSLAVAGTPLPVVLGPYVPAWPGGEGGRMTSALKRLLRGAQQRRAAAVLLSTPAAAAKLDAAPRRLLVRELSPGIDPRTWRPSGEPAAGPDVLFLANLQPRKGVLIALDAFERLAGDVPDARLLVAGAGPQEAELRRRVAASRVGDRVRLLGPLPREQVVGAMQACAVYCMPSLGEPLGMSALEAMACGRPVVGTVAGGLRFLVPEGGGLMVPPGDAEALAGALARVLSSPALQRAMGGLNRRAVEERYAWSRVVERLEGVYGDAIAARRRRS